MTDSDYDQVLRVRRFIDEFKLPDEEECKTQEKAYGKGNLPQHWATPLYYYRKGYDREEVAIELLKSVTAHHERFQETIPQRRMGVVLQGTSQGGRYDRPPEEFIRDELYAFGARAPQARHPSLTGTVLDVFAGSRWLLDDSKGGLSAASRMNSIYQSCILASRLVKLSGSFLMAMLPQPGVAYCRVMPFRGKESAETDGRVKESLRELAKYMRWKEDSHILRHYNWLGTVHHGLGGPDRPIGPQSAEDLDAADGRDRASGSRYRQKMLVIASELIDNVIETRAGSDEKVFAVWLLALEMVKQLGRFVLLHRFECDQHRPDPAWDDYVDRDIGESWVAWLFGGWVLRPHMYPYQLPYKQALLQGLQWEKMYRAGYQSPEWTVAYSCQVSYLDNLLANETWAPYRTGRVSGEHAAFIRETLLHPTSPFQKGETARRALKVGLAWHLDTFKLGVVRPGEMLWIDVAGACGNTFDDQDWSEEPTKEEGNKKGRKAEQTWKEEKGRKRVMQEISSDDDSVIAAPGPKRKRTEAARIAKETVDSYDREMRELAAKQRAAERKKSAAEQTLRHLQDPRQKESVMPVPGYYDPTDSSTHQPLPLDLLGPEPEVDTLAADLQRIIDENNLAFSDGNFEPAQLNLPTGEELNDPAARAAMEEVANSITLDDIWQIMGQNPPDQYHPPPPFEGEEDATMGPEAVRKRQTKGRVSKPVREMGEGAKISRASRRISWYVIRSVLDAKPGEPPATTVDRVRSLRATRRQELSEVYKKAIARKRSIVEDMRECETSESRSPIGQGKENLLEVKQMPNVRYWLKPPSNYDCDSCVEESGIDEDKGSSGHFGANLRVKRMRNTTSARSSKTPKRHTPGVAGKIQGGAREASGKIVKKEVARKERSRKGSQRQ